MCKSHNPRKIDRCMKNIIWLVKNRTEYVPVASCCGHGKYYPTLIVSNKRGHFFEYFNMIEIPRKKRFYTKDKQGYYFIKECLK